MSDTSSDTVALATEDLPSGSCQVCVSGSRPLSGPCPPAVVVPSVSETHVTVTQALSVASQLATENCELRSRLELVEGFNVDLAAHASVLHDRNLAVLRRAREGYQIGVKVLSKLHGERDALQADLRRLREQLEDSRTVSFEAGRWRGKYNVLVASSTEQYQELQRSLTEAQNEVALLSARLDASVCMKSDSSVQTIEPARSDALVQTEDEIAMSISIPISSDVVTLPPPTSSREQLKVAAIERDRLVHELPRISKERHSVAAELQTVRDSLSAANMMSTWLGPLGSLPRLICDALPHC